MMITPQARSPLLSSGRHVSCPAPPPSSPTYPSSPREPQPCSLVIPLGAPDHSSDPHSRRHSWQPPLLPQPFLPVQYRQRSVSLEQLNPEEFKGLLMGALRTSSSMQGRSDPRRAPITSYGQELGSLLSLTEEEVGSEEFNQYDSRQRSCSLSNSCYKRHCHESFQGLGGSSLSVDADLEEVPGPEQSNLGVDKGREEVEEEAEEEEEKRRKAGHLGRTLSFLRKMATNHKNKEKDRMKEREKEARERESRYSNGHLFTSMTVSATTLCSSCNRSITAKEALSCPSCNVTIHNRCRDSLASCAKMKQKQQKLALVRNSSLQNVAMRSKTPMMKERPSSAIYPSDSLRQSLLGARRVRTGLSLAKSVSTNNIAGYDDSPVGLRRILSQSSESLNFRNRTMSLESLNDEGEVYYSSLMDDLQREGVAVCTDSWSMAVDPSYLHTHRKDNIKRQDVIYELIQTEFHHVRTLRIMDGVFRRGMQDEVMLEAGVAHAVFPCLDQLLEIHRGFLHLLMERRRLSLAAGSNNNYSIEKLGDVLVQQFSGQRAEEMRKAYSEFCSRHPKAVKLYKELLARDKRFTQFIRRVTRGPLLRRHGIQECILLVTQRITKYPVLIQRILDNTKGNEEEVQSLSSALHLLKELISAVDREVLDLERTQRLQEIQARLDPRAQAELRGGGVFQGGELLRRRLVHDGTLLWKIQGSRMKDVQVLLMSDILVFLQDKDQKFSFASLDKPPVLSLNKLIVRDMANQERGMFVISDSTPPEMYELYAASKDDRKTWMSLIQKTVVSCPSREEFPLIETEDKALIRRLRADIQQKDREVLELLQERVTLFSDLAEATGGIEGVGKETRNLFRVDSPHAPKAEHLLNQAVSEVDRLSELLLGSTIDLPKPSTTPVTNGNQDQNGRTINGDMVCLNGSYEENSSLSKDPNGNQLQDRGVKEEVCQRLKSLSTQLHALQAAVVCQDSFVELCLSVGPPSTPSPSTPTTLGPAPLRLNRSVSRDTGMGMGLEVAGVLQKELLQEEVLRLRPLEARLKESEEARLLLEQRLREEQASRRRGSSDPESRPLCPLASQDPVDQLDGVQESSEDEEEPDVVGISPRSDSPRDLQDIPEESECGTETTHT